MNHEIPFRDRLLTPEQAAEWAGLPLRTLMDKHRAGIIPGFHIGGGRGESKLRFLPRAIEATLAQRARMPKEVIKMLANSEDATQTTTTQTN